MVIPLPQAPSCADMSTCRAAALEAQARKEFETFHNLAWLAYRKGRADDPELMLLLARAQSLSGRPGDAIVMLERLASKGFETDAATSEDFASVRALPRWAGARGQSSDVSLSAPAAVPAVATPSTPLAAPVAPSPTPRRPAPNREAGTPLPFTTILTPSALAYDAVSRRFIIADRAARRIAVIDENTGHVATLVGAQAALGEIGGMAIDPQQGDLWVVSSSADGARLHRMQLISGRLLSTIALSGPQDAVVALAFVRNVGLVLADASGTIWHVRAGGRRDKLGALEYVPRMLATDGEGRLYVAAGAPRLARFALTPSLRKIDVL
ncbi:MAG: hypothetical protein H0U19_12210, partial [Acidobacteria bacterium]|nr:hypothetical protein [Acidobacteriota bacterium]